MKQFIATYLFVISLFFNSYGQNERTINQAQLNKVINNTFSSLVTSTANNSVIGYYATLDPTDASFSLKGSIPITIKGKDQKAEDKLKIKPTIMYQKEHESGGNISYLSFSLSGNLIDKSYASIFTNTSLNSGISFSAQYNFRFNPPKFSYSKFSYFLNDKDYIELKENTLKNSYLSSINENEINYSDSLVQSKLRLLKFQISDYATKLDRLQMNYDLLNKTIDSLGENINTHPELIDSLDNTMKGINNMKSTYDKTIATKDSLTNVADKLSSLQNYQQDLLENKFKSDYDSLVMKMPLLTYQFGWLTLIGGVSRGNYYTFNSSILFNSQIASHQLNDFQLGLGWNYISVNKLKKRTIFFNINLIRQEDNNLPLLSTTEVDQTQKIVSPTGDTTRMITKKYNAYTDSVDNFLEWSLAANFYCLWGKNPSGIHISPSIDFEDRAFNLTNFLLGYLMSFKNSAKDQTTINTELYVKFKDVFNVQKSTAGILKRNEIGVTFTLPFNF